MPRKTVRLSSKGSFARRPEQLAPVAASASAPVAASAPDPVAAPRRPAAKPPRQSMQGVMENARGGLGRGKMY